MIKTMVVSPYMYMLHHGSSIYTLNRTTHKNNHTVSVEQRIAASRYDKDINIYIRKTACDFATYLFERVNHAPSATIRTSRTYSRP